jgi:hypothetical protein
MSRVTEWLTRVPNEWLKGNLRPVKSTKPILHTPLSNGDPISDVKKQLRQVVSDWLTVTL